MTILRALSLPLRMRVLLRTMKRHALMTRLFRLARRFTGRLRKRLLRSALASDRMRDVESRVDLLRITHSLVLVVNN
jgi:hypothetical protein